MADIQTFVAELSNKGKQAKPRKSQAFDDVKEKLNFERARDLYMPTIKAGLEAAGDDTEDLDTALDNAELAEMFEDWKGAADCLIEAHELAQKALNGPSGKDATDKLLYDKARKSRMPTIEAARADGGDAADQIDAALLNVEVEEMLDDWKGAGTKLAEAYNLARDLSAKLKKDYQDARKPKMEAISNAMGLTEIGGGAVASRLARADALADAGKWTEAKLRLGLVEIDAKKVNARAPFVRACRRHQDTIKAAFALTHNDIGKTFKADWEKALKTAETGDYDQATRDVEGLSKRVEQAKNDPVVKTAREEVARARTENVNAMKSAVTGNDVDVSALRALVLKEIGTPDTTGLAGQANALGDDPGAKTREPIGDEKGAEDLFKENDWFALKKKLHAGKVTADQMWDCWRYRQQFVTKLIDVLRKKFPTLIAKTSGSTDLESDIDITFASTSPGDDVTAASQFNALVKAKFGKPPGRVFDVNIYPRDYNAITESINPDYAVDPIVDKDIDQPTGSMQKLSRVDQDVATLLKQRRFLDDESFNALMKGVVDGVSDPDTKKQVTKQFEEGEDIFLLTAFEKVDRIQEKLRTAKQPLPPLPLLAQFDALRSKGSKGDQQSVIQAQKLLPKVLDELEEALPAEVMEATDEMYLEKMGELRKDQVRIGKLDSAGGEPNEHHEGTCEEVHKNQEHDAWRKAEAERLKAKVKKDQFTNIVFANEAYMSQGAIEHVVAGIQAKDPAKKEAIFAKLTPATLMQSCNEQLADFFKDMKSSESEIEAEPDETKKRRHTGEAFVHASKYLVRLLDAAQLLSDKFAKFTPPVPLEFTLIKKAAVPSPGALMKKVEAVLLALRKSATVPADAKGEVGVDEARALFGVDDIGAFRKLISEFGAELNQKVRSAPDFKAELAVDQATERQYFGVPEMPADLKALLGSVEPIISATFADANIDAAIAESEGEVEAAQELLDEPIPDGNPGKRKYLAEQADDAVARAGLVLTALMKSDINGLVQRAAAVVRDAMAKINELNTYDDEDLHDAYRNDITKAIARLRAKADNVNAAKSDVQRDLKQAILSLNGKVGELKKLQTTLKAS